MSQKSGTFSAPAPLVALCAWLLPGAGYLLIGQRTRGIVVGVTIITLFISGVLFAGVRVVDVPGYDDLGRAPYVRIERSRQDQREVREFRSIRPDSEPVNNDWTPVSNWRWALRAHPLAEIANKPWYVSQILTGPLCLAASYGSIEVSKAPDPRTDDSAVRRSHGRIYEIGTLYTAVAGMLNLMAIIDAAFRAGDKPASAKIEDPLARAAAAAGSGAAR